MRTNLQDKVQGKLKLIRWDMSELCSNVTKFINHISARMGGSGEKQLICSGSKLSSSVTKIVQRLSGRVHRPITQDGSSFLQSC